MKKAYLITAVIGAIVPVLFFMQFIRLNGLDISAFGLAVFVNGAAGGFSADLFISSFVFWAFMCQQERSNSGPNPWLFIILNLGIGLSCALPAYLYAKEKSRRYS